MAKIQSSLKTSSANRPPWAIGLLVLIIAAAAVLAVVNRFSKPATAPQASANNAAQIKDVTALIAKVGKHIVVNANEQPNVATVQDPVLLRTQNPIFYQDAQVGDRLLVWSDKAVLYSPSRDIILAVVPLRATAAATSTPPLASSGVPASSTEKATIEVRNGSGRAGLGKTLADKLTASGFTVLPPGNASARIASTIIVKAAGKDLPETIQKLRDVLNAQVVELPTGETALKGDVLVIIGTDYQP